MRWLAIIIFVAATLCPGTTRALLHGDWLTDRLPPELSISASLRTRWEYWNFFRPVNRATNNYDFLGSRARFGARWSTERFDLVLEGQANGLIDLPADAIGDPGGPLGLGALYRLNNRRASDGSVFIKQGYALLKDVLFDGLTVKGGRFRFNGGLEVLSGDPTLDWLKRFRISQRLLGDFDWSQVGRSFDGATVGFTRGPFNFTAFYSKPTQGGFDLAANKGINDIDLVYTAVNLTRPWFTQNSDGRIFYIYYGDSRGLVPVDNRPLPVREAGGRKISISTVGADWLHIHQTPFGLVDLLAWGVLQRGRWARLDQCSWAWAAELGLQPDGTPWKPWLRTGWNRSSGDDDPFDDRHDTFFQIIPTGRLYSFSTAYNLMNNEDIFGQLILRPVTGMVWRTDLHVIRLTERNDLWYFGSGATVANRQIGFGYGGRPSSGKRNLMTVLETQFSYRWSPHVQMTFYYGHEFGNSVVRNLFADDNADFLYLELTLRL